MTRLVSTARLSPRYSRAFQTILELPGFPFLWALPPGGFHLKPEGTSPIAATIKFRCQRRSSPPLQRLLLGEKEEPNWQDHALLVAGLESFPAPKLTLRNTVPPPGPLLSTRCRSGATAIMLAPQTCTTAKGYSGEAFLRPRGILLIDDLSQDIESPKRPPLQWS